MMNRLIVSTCLFFLCLLPVLATDSMAEIKGRCVPTPPCYCNEECFRCGPGGCGSTNSGGGGYSTPSYDYEAERLRKEAEAAEQERKRKEAEAAELERKRKEEERFINDRDEAAATLKGSVGGTPVLKGLGSEAKDNYGLKGSASSAGSQLKRVEGHSNDAAGLDKEPMSKEARKGFDTAGSDRGTIVVPKISGTMPTLLDKQVPEEARNDDQVQQMLKWYRELEGKKAAANKEIAALKKQQATSKDPLLAVKIEQYNINLQKYASDQAVATKNAKERVKKLGYGYKWNETGETKQQEGAKK